MRLWARWRGTTGKLGADVDRVARPRRGGAAWANGPAGDGPRRCPLGSGSPGVDVLTAHWEAVPRRGPGCGPRKSRAGPGLRRGAGACGFLGGAACRHGGGACVPGKPPKQLLSPNLCPSCARVDPRLPCACACVYSSPSRRTPAGAAARTPRTGYCGRRRRSDRPFRTGLQRWLEEGHVLSQAPVFHEFLESIYFNFKVLIWTESSILAQDERWRRA